MRDITTLTLVEAEHVVDAVQNQGFGDAGAPIAVAVVGSDGRLISFAAQDGVLHGSIDIAQHKAYTAVVLQRDTLDHHRAVPPKNPANYGDPKICFMAGGVVIRVKGKIIGAVGVSGRKAFRPDRQTDEAGFEDSVLTDHELACCGRDAFLKDLRV